MRTAARILTAAALLLAALAAAEGATPVEAKVDAAILSGGDLPYPITLAFEDAYAFWALPDPRSNLDLPDGWPTRLDAQPVDLGIGYELQSGIAAALLGNNPFGLWRDVEFGEGRVPRSTYYPGIGAVELHIGGDPPRWARLDAGRAAILDRYIRLGRAGELPEQPGILDVLAADARDGRPTSVVVGDRPLTTATLEEFWRIAGSATWPEVEVYGSRLGAKLHTGAPADYDEAIEAMVYGYAEPDWLSLEIDGREVRLAYYPTTGVIAGLPLPSNSAWIGRGFVIPPELREAFHASLDLPPLLPPSAAESTVPTGEGESRAASAPDSRLEGSSGNVAALAFVGLAALLAYASASFVRGRRRETA